MERTLGAGGRSLVAGMTPWQSVTEPQTSMGINTPFNHRILRDSLFDLLENLPEGTPTEASILGSGPFEATDLDEFLRWIGVDTFVPSAREGALVVGRQNWTKEELGRLVLGPRRSQRLRVYTQEMFLFFLITGYDPYHLEPNERHAFIEDHPAFTCLMKLGFAWPTTEVSSGDAQLQSDWPNIGLLKYMGYSVGRSGLPARDRRRILKSVFTGTLPNVTAADYMAQWGKPRSEVRLAKMARSIAAFCRNARRKARRPDQAIDQWEQDLHWLKRTYYDGRFSFRWPPLPPH